jgi:hypothetical protein
MRCWVVRRTFSPGSHFEDAMANDELSESTLYGMLGGEDAISAIIDAVYRRMLLDHTLLQYGFE